MLCDSNVCILIYNETPRDFKNGIALWWHTEPKIWLGKRCITSVCVCERCLSLALIPLITDEETEAEVIINLFPWKWGINSLHELWILPSFLSEVQRIEKFCSGDSFWINKFNKEYIKIVRDRTLCQNRLHHGRI